MFQRFFIFIFLTLINNGDCEFVKCIADCVELKECHEAKEFLRVNRTLPELCGFNGAEPLVCCAAKNEKTLFEIHYGGLRKAEKKCKELYPPSIPRHTEGGLIYGHEELGYGIFPVTEYQYPYMTVLEYGDPKNPLYICGGVLVDSNVVITAAHCAEINGEPPLVARIGSIALLSNDSEPIDVLKVISHPNYNQQTDQNDIAIIILAENSKQSPACLFTQRLNLRHDNRTLALGFGTTTFAGRFSDILGKTYYNIIQKHFCEREYQGQPLLDSQLCALGERRYFENGTSLVQDTCQGDSGGPLVIDRDHTYVVGVVSYGRYCGSETPGIYTYIASYTNWINSTLRREGNNDGLNECMKIEPPYITVSFCSGGGSTGKSCSGVAYITGRYNWDFPYIVKLGYGDIKNPVYECNGFLVDKNVVITAAQCTQVNGKKPLVIEISNSIIPIAKVIPHPNYEYKNYLHDIAVLFLADSTDVVPTCLWSSSLDLENEDKFNEAFAVGFGTTSFDGPLLTELLQVPINMYNKSICSKEQNYKPLPDSLFCVSHGKTTYVGEDTYQVYSGGPLYYSRAITHRYVVGIVSYADDRVIYTNITSYLDWIESVIWPEGTQADRFYIT